MKKLLLFFVPVLFMIASCSKGVNNEVKPTDPNGNDDIAINQGSIAVKCDNCKIDYGQPDQYKGLNVAGTSPASSYTYSPGYTLQANIYALDHDQDITYTVYDTKGKVVYLNKVTQSVEGYWAVNVLLP